MKRWSRREVLKTSLAAQAAVLTPAPGFAALAQSGQAQSGFMPAPRERALLDFGWRFHFGHADDATKDFGFGA